MKNTLWIFISFVSFLVISQEPEVILSVSPTNANVGETITITVKSNVQGHIEIDNLPSSFVYGYDIMNGMEQETDYNTGQVITYYYSSQTGVIVKPGKYTIGPAFVKKGNIVYQSEKVTVNIEKKTPLAVGVISDKQLKDPAFGTIQVNKKTIYEGEPILALAKVYSKYNPTSLSGYVPFSIKGAIESHSLGLQSNIKVTQEQFKGLDLFTFEYDRKLIFPNGTGTFQIEPYKMNLFKGYKSFPIVSSAAVVNIRPLPANPPSDFIGGVGQFEISREIDTCKIKQGDVFKMSILVSGTGNLQNTTKPKLNLPKELIVYGDPVVTENISYNSKGADGSILYEYNVQATNFGDITLPPVTLSYFDLKTESYQQKQTKEKKIVVEKNQSFVVTEVENKIDEETGGKPIHSELRKKPMLKTRNTWLGSPVFWAGISTPIITAFLFFFVTKKREENQEELAAKQIIREKSKESQDLLAKSEALLNQGPEVNDAFFSSVETAIKKAFEVEMNIQQDRILNKNEILEFVKNSEYADIHNEVADLFAKCEMSRFGMAASDESKQIVFNQLSLILNRLKK